MIFNVSAFAPQLLLTKDGLLAFHLYVSGQYPCATALTVAESNKL